MIPKGCVLIKKQGLSLGFKQQIASDLIIIPKSVSSFTPNPKPIKIYWEDENYFGVPRGYYNVKLKSRGVEGSLDFSIGKNDLLSTDPIKPREGQDIAIDQMVRELRSNPFSGSILEAKVGSGKTPMSLEIARRLGHKTLVVVHTSVLADQWAKEIPNFFPNWRIGRLQASKIDVKDKDIVIGMLQSASMKDYEDWVYEEFGTVIFDELHVLGSQEFSKAIFKYNPKYMYGVSGTLKRSDRTENVFKYGLGKVISVMDVAKNLDPVIYFVNTGFIWNKAQGYALDKRKNFFEKAAVGNVERNEIIISNACKAAMANRNVLVLTKRVEHAYSLGAEIKKRLGPHGYTVGVMVGQTKKDEREIAKKANVIIATVQLIGTGFNEPRLDTLIFASIIQNVDQSIGRIQRLLDGKKTPMVIDLFDPFSDVSLEFALSRIKKYKLKKWKIFGDVKIKEFDDKKNGVGSIIFKTVKRS